MTMLTWIYPIVLIGVTALGVWLEVFLAKKESRWPGLVLPIIFFAFSLLMVLNTLVSDEMTSGQIAASYLSTLFFANIPTIVLLAVYFGCRQSRKKQLEKMYKQDLE